MRRGLASGARAIAALDDELRRRLFLFIRDSGRPVGRDEAAEAVGRLCEAQKRLERRARGLLDLALKAEAQELIEAVAPGGGRRIISRIFEDRDFEELKLLAHRLVAHESVVALLASRDQATARLVFARSADLQADMSALLRAACEALGGRGGGKPDFAQGGTARLGELERELTIVISKLENEIE